jgi:hypothetical protein
MTACKWRNLTHFVKKEWGIISVDFCAGTDYIVNRNPKARVAELADALDLGSSPPGG